MRKQIIALALACLLLLGCACAEGKLSVQGEGTVMVTADQASVTLGVNRTGEDVAALQAEVNETINNIYAALAEAGLDAKDVSTGSIYIYPQYDYSGEVSRLTGYQIGSNLCIFSEDTDKVGTYIDAAFAAGANSFESISFSLKNDVEAKREALKLAVQNAQDKATVMAEAAGQTLGELSEINENGVNSYDASNYMMQGARMAYETSTADGGASTQINAAQMCVTATVSMIYELK